MFVDQILQFVGIAIILAFVKFLFKYVWSFFCNTSIWGKIEDKYVVVTGATQEIGREICRQIADEKVKLIMIDSDREELESLKQEIESKIEVVYYVVDFNKTADNYNIFSFLEEYDIGLLINSCNTVDRGFESFVNRRDDKIIHTNILSTTHITHRVIAQMVEKRVGFVIFIGDAAFDLPVPFCSVYSASLAYLHQLASSLYYEMGKFGIVVEYVRYGSILRTRNDRNDGICHNDPKKFVTGFLRTFGSSRETIPRFYHIVLHCIVFCIPQFVIGQYYSGVNENRLSERERKERKWK